MAQRLKFGSLRLGGTSWVVAGDLADNARELSKEVSDMEIVLFDTEQASNIPSADEILRLKELCGELDISCTVHFPTDLCLSQGKKQQNACEDKCLEIAELFAPLEPFAWILHLDGDIRGEEVPSENIERWRALAHSSLNRIAVQTGFSQKICVETLDYNFSYAYDIVLQNGLSICTDVGHLVRYRRDVTVSLQKYLPHTRVLHIHGVKADGTDHADMSYFDTELLRKVLTLCDDGSERVMSMEVFEEDYYKSLEVFRKLL